jgi:argininosuccinate lyase
MKLWEKKYQLNKEIESYTVGNDHIFDQKLVKYDCKGSIAHVKMLNKIGVLTKDESHKLIMVLYEIIKLDDNGSFIIEQKDEDCHTAIENYLTDKLSNIGKKIHTARSRNDQVLTALRLYYKDEIDGTIQLIDILIKTLYLLKEKYGDIKLPGYTHMRKAMPSSVDLWVDSFIDSMKDNKKLLKWTYELINQSPLGTGTGYGLPINIDRKMTAKILGFKKIQKNPIYVQNSRGKFESTILHGLSQIMFDLNKISNDLILFSMPEFGFFTIPSEFNTGSSIMPHKKNPDALEIIRANYHKIIGYEYTIKSIIGNLISGYNRDLQLTKEPIMNGYKITKNSLEVMKIILENLKINQEKCKKAMSKELYATQKVYDLVKKGVSFRDAYKQISEQYCII